MRRRAVEAMRQGAYDYFRKPFDIDERPLVIARGLDGSERSAAGG